MADEASKDALGRHLKKITVNAETLQTAFAELRELLPPIPQSNDGTLPDWRMEEVKLVLDITASGGLALVGTANVAVKGAVEVLFKRNR